MLMPPNNQKPSPAPSDYDFIMNPGAAKPKQPRFSNIGNSKRQRRLIVGTGGAIVLILFIFIYSLIFGGKNQPLLEVAQQQQELIRISLDGMTQAQSSTAKALTVTTELTAISNQKEVLAQLKKHGQKTNPKLLAAKKSLQTDQALAQGTQENRYDEALIKAIKQDLVKYQTLLKAAYTATGDQTLQQILNNQFSQAGLLIASAQSS